MSENRKKKREGKKDKGRTLFKLFYNFTHVQRTQK